MDLIRLKELFEKGYSDKEISEVLDENRKRVTDFRYRNFGKKSNEEIQRLSKMSFRYYDVFSDKYVLSILIGTLLGDAWITKSSTESCRGGVQHKESHIEYLKFKHNIFKLFSNKILPKKSYINKTVFPQNYFAFNASPSLKKLHDLLYINGRKTITRELLEYMTIDSIIMWYLDDGNIIKGRRGSSYCGYKISVYSFDLESLKLIQEFLLEKYNIKTSLQNSNNAIYIKSESKELFRSYLYKYWDIKCMQYKMAN